MPFKKGDDNINRVGRPVGSPNKTTQEMRDAIQLIAENNIDKFQKWIDIIGKDNPIKAMELNIALYEYFIPKLQRTEVKHEGDVTVNTPVMKWADDKGKS